MMPNEVSSGVVKSSHKKANRVKCGDPSINILGRQQSSTSGIGVIDVEMMATFFKNKVDEIRASTADADEPTYTMKPTNCSFTAFEPVDVQAVIKLIRADAPLKTSPIDPLPMWLLKVCAVELHRS
jgi:hypothetical protein